jgi:NADH dehydrogenase [ubiquinone] 1 alpha subcomplex assembly factor 3
MLRLALSSARNAARVSCPRAGQIYRVLPTRSLHSTTRLSGTTTLPNILAGGPAPAVVVKTLTPRGIQLDDGLIIPGACIFLEGEVFLWDAATTDAWAKLSEADLKARFEVFETVVPRPGVSSSTMWSS